MVKSLCSSESDRYSSPVPYVGLYIAGATLVCLLLMLCDMISSFRRRTRYLPCKLFSINSVTLFLLATASKLPVDLTTYMPSHVDQLSKLSSTAMLCVSIIFLAPSFGINREAESITNLITLSLMVITIVVNVCIQMYTGVIFSLVIEHIIILCCMMSLLPLLWWSISANNSGKTIITDTNRDLFKKGTEAKSFVHQAKLWYMCSCITNPQYLICGLVSPIMAANCAACLAVLSYAAFRSIVFHKSEFCKGVSDYGWSIWIIVITQIITVMVGSLGSFFRSIDRLGTVLLSGRGDRSGLQQMNPSHHIESEKVAFNFFTKKKGLGKVVSIIMLSRLLLRSLVLIISLCVMIIFGLIPGLSIIVCVLVLHLLHSVCPTIHLIMTSSDSGASKITSPWKQELQHHVASVIEGFPERIMRVCAEDMKKWMDASNRNPLNHLVKFLSEPPSSTAVLDEVQQIGSKTFSKGYRLSCLTFVILERIISFSIPSARAESITQALDEAFEMIYYIDGKINVSKFDDQRKHHLAKTLWAYKGVYLSKNGSSTHSNNSSMSDAISSIKNEHQQFHAGNS
ncbi:hypothetical protein Syun_006118 [Stephania yunnanensis]|uniref:Uncharacterized protein n=1 Tax=Stephania yunnanensis TaxID=152371 RepID=A0AAP0KW07_9MAGN